MNKQILVIGVGSGAKNVIDNLYQKDKDFDFLCIDDKKQFLNLSKTKNIWFNDIEFQRTNNDIEYYKNVLLNKTNTLKEELKNYNRAIIIANLGESFVSEMLVSIIEYVKEFEMSHCIFAIKPFKLNLKGFVNFRKITKQLSEMSYILGNDLFLYDSNEVYKKYSPNSINEANKMVIENASLVLKMIFELNN